MEISPTWFQNSVNNDDDHPDVSNMAVSRFIPLCCRLLTRLLGSCKKELSFEICAYVVLDAVGLQYNIADTTPKAP